MVWDISQGTILDNKYRILFKLGDGGFGEVYLAEDLLIHNRQVAIKSLTLDDPNREQYLIREMEFLSDLDHPHIIRFYHHFNEHGSLFLVMEFCSGGSLWQALQKNVRFDTEQVTTWAIELCQTLQMAHEKGIVHHDLKPENILFDEAGILKIGDFGVANTRIGTIPYMAPELFLVAENVSRRDGRVDIYALGITILELLTGETPFLSLSDEEALDTKVRLNFIPESLPLWLREILLKALNPKPELRFQTMREFQEALESQHVPYVFNRKIIQAHKAALKAEWHLSRKKWVKAKKIVEQALFQDPDCLNALVTAGNCELSLRRVEKASRYFERAIRINPRVNIQKELGWIYLEEGRYPEAISMLNDHLKRNAADYEAYNLLTKAFYCTGRYEAASELIHIILQDYKDNKCFENNLLLCELLLGQSGEEVLHKVDTENPFIEYNWKVFKEEPSSWDIDGKIPLKSKLLFQEFRFGNPKKYKPNVLVVENIEGEQWHFDQPIISLGRNEGNDIIFPQSSVSRLHCVLVNYADDVWLYDLGSTLGTLCDESPVQNSIFLEGRHQISLSDSSITILTKEGILL
jgi:serine/threonine protein kinase